MPTAPPQRCTYTGAEGKCTTLVTNGGRCPQHRPPPWATRSKHWGTGSTRRWRATRATHLAHEPHCRHCAQRGITTPGTEVDHITPLSQGGAQDDPANLQTLCTPCHDRKTRAEASQRTRRASL